MLGIVSIYSLYFPLETIRRYFESQKRKADVEARSQEDVDAKIRKNRRAVKKHFMLSKTFNVANAMNSVVTSLVIVNIKGNFVIKI